MLSYMFSLHFVFPGAIREDLDGMTYLPSLAWLIRYVTKFFFISEAICTVSFPASIWGTTGKRTNMFQLTTCDILKFVSWWRLVVCVREAFFRNVMLHMVSRREGSGFEI